MKRRQALVRNAAPLARLAVGPVPEASGTPIHDADRHASRRFTAATLGLGTVLPGLGRAALHRPYHAAFAALVLSRPAIEGSPP